MKAKYLGFAFMCLIIIAGGCKHSPTETIDTDKPGRRDYSWTVDTLSFWDELFTLHDLWGANENDIWVIAVALSSAQALWHYNGIGWKLYKELVNNTDEFRSIYVTKDMVAITGERYLNGAQVYGLIIIGRR